MKSPRILIVRTDRMGDVILSTPVIHAIRSTFPGAYLGMMVRPEHQELVEGHPDLDRVILYDKRGTEKSILGSIRFALQLRKDRFDTAIILHSTNRVILVSWLAGISRRIGYGRRLPWLLTEAVPYRKPEGSRHEIEYNFDLLRCVGIQSVETALAVPIQPAQEEKAAVFLEQEGVVPDRPLVALHPGASCPSKRWPVARFAQLADRLIEADGAQIVVVTGPDQIEQGQAVLNQMQHPATAALGVLSLGELAALFKRVRCLVSNDSGPVHLACAVKTPVISIFGRWGGGLSPVRWGPTGPNSLFLHKDVGCRPCLAHDCTIGFVCLEAISVEETYRAVRHLADLKVLEHTTA